MCGDNWSVPVEYSNKTYDVDDDVRNSNSMDGHVVYAESKPASSSTGSEPIADGALKQTAPLQGSSAHRVTFGSLDDISLGVCAPPLPCQISPVQALLNKTQSPTTVQIFPRAGTSIMLSSISAASGAGCAGPVSPYLARGPEGLGTFPSDSSFWLQSSPSKH